jgi:hypothetical protein
MISPDIIDLFRLKPGKKVRLKDHDTGWAQTKELKELGKDVVKERAREILDKNLEDLAEAPLRRSSHGLICWLLVRLRR